MFARLIPALLLTIALAGCRPGKRAGADLEALQSPAAEAALRHIIEHCPKRNQAKLAVIGLGDYLKPPTPEFVERFKDLAGLTFIDHRRVVAGMVDGQSRRFDEYSQQPVLELQISSLTEPRDGVQQAVAAWAFIDDAQRKRLEVKAKPGGGYDVRELETIPVPHRNDDTRRAEK
jgi:hypothetical protein